MALEYSLKMLATDQAEAARQYLIDADRAYDAGDMLKASEKLWDAAAHVVTAEMRRRGFESNGLHAMIVAMKTIADEHDDPALIGMFISARLLQANSLYGFMEDYEFEFDRDIVRRFVDRMLELGD